MKKNKVNIITLGCSKNLVDSEQLMRQFELNGFTVTHDPDVVDGDIVVVNTCGFIGDAQEESVNLIVELEEAKKKGQIGRLYVMGCLSERFYAELNQELPLVDKFYGKFNWKELIGDIGQSYREEFSSDRVLTTPSHYAYLKISEGCSRTCAYCSIPIITGKHRSRPLEAIVAEAQGLVEKGVKEIQLIAQDLTFYGLDLYKKKMLPELTDALSAIRGVEWIRLHYAYPADFPYELLDIMQKRANVCKYLDIALQHISDAMLQKMRRKVSKQETYDLLARIRQEVPGIHLRTTLMVGFPGETEADFEELIDFVKDIRFERLGAFAYSHETGTYAHKHYTDNIPEEVKQERLDYLMRVQQQIAHEINETKVGQTFRTIVDRQEGTYYIGRTAFDSPEVDPEILIETTGSLQVGHFYDVQVTGAEAFDLFGKIVN